MVSEVADGAFEISWVTNLSGDVAIALRQVDLSNPLGVGERHGSQSFVVVGHFLRLNHLLLSRLIV